MEPQSCQWYNGQAHTSVPQRFNKTKSKGRLILVSTKKMYNVKCKLSFIWGHVRAAAQETEDQVTLSNGSKEIGRRRYICDFGKRAVHEIKHIFLL